jgi:hypothetical protein
LFGFFSRARCAEPAYAGGKAVVVATGPDSRSRELPFLNTQSGWKFDGLAYFEKYPVTGKGAHSKGKGKAKGARSKKRSHL